MIKTTLKSVFLSSVTIGLFFAMSPKTMAVDYFEQEVTLQRQGDFLISDVIVDRQAFNSVVIRPEKEIGRLMVNFGNGWEKVESVDDDGGPDHLMVMAPTHSMQFRLDEPGTADSFILKTTLFYYEEDKFSRVTSDLQASTDLTARAYKVITRKEWGADEELRVWNPDKSGSTGESNEDEKPSVDPCADIAKSYASDFKITAIKEYNDDGQSLTWPLQYASKLEKFSIHHTDSEIRDINGDTITDTRDYQAIVRAIYYYHTVSRGWGDIGYNYLIDPLGNIYEGRAGGDKVIGAHTLCFNHGVLGIAVIGNYQTEEVPEPAMQALIWLIGTKGKQYGIDPQGASDFRGKNLPNVFGHRDVRATTCPGDAFYNELSRVRDRAALAMRSFSESGLTASDYDYNAELVGDLDLSSLGPGERKFITLKFKNTGKKSWDNTTWLHVALNNDPNARVVPVVQDKSFVAGDLQEKSVAPGKTGSFIVELEGGFKPGHYAFQVSPVVNGRYKISRASEYINFQVQDPAYSYEVITHKFPSGTVFQGQKIQATLEIKNTGNVTWRNYGNNAIVLGASDPKDRASIFVKDNPSRIGYLADNQVAPGGIGHFVMNLTVPEDHTGEVIERFIPVIENAGWMDDKALGFKVTIKKPVHFARTVKVDTLSSLYPGERKFVELDMKNMGDLPWDSSTVETALLGRGIKVFKRLLLPQEPVKPGQTMKIGFWVEAPLEAGSHTISVRASFNGKPIRGGMAQYVVNVAESVLHAGKIDQGESIVSIKPRVEKELTVKFKNTGNVVWKKMGPNAVHLGTANPNDRPSKLYLKSDWLDPFRPAELEEDEVMPGNIGTFKFKVRSDVQGRFAEDFQLVMEGVGWVPGANVKWQVNVSNTASSTATSTAKPATTTPAAPTTPTTTPTVPVTQPVTTTEDPFRVRLTYAANTPTLTADKDFLVLNEKDQAILSLAGGKQITVKRVANTFQITSGSLIKTATIVRLVPKEADGVVTIVSMERRPTWNLDLNDNKFRGVVEMRVIDNAVAYINELPLEDYLKGLAEVSNGDPTEKLKTIAVLARTYARFYMSDDNRKFPDMPYDGSDDPAIFQRYLGYGVETRSPNFVTAVKDTEDMVVTYAGKLVKTPYFNQSDGRTRSAQEVWGWTTTPYLISVSDPACKGLELKGHGVGLSGFGATAMANEGKKFDEIIKYYYTGVAVTKVEQ